MEEREQWSSRTAFILASMGSAIGLGNLLRYPSIAWSNHGLQWFIPYILALFFIGIPLLLFEIAIGQTYRSTSVVALGRINNRFRGLGFAVILNAYIVATYYNVIIAWCLKYLGYLFPADGNLPFKDDAQSFFFEKIVEMKSLADSTGEFITSTYLICVGVWIIVFFAIFRGVDVLGKIVYVTMGLPLIMLVVILARGISLENAGRGIKYYVAVWRGETLSDPAIWQGAVGQIFFSIGAGFGVFTTYASYNPKLQNAVQDALIIGISNSLFEIVGAFAAFGVAGYLDLNPAKDKLSTFVLGFFTYPAALARVPGAQFWCFLFFINLFLLGIDSAFSLVEGAVTLIHDAGIFGNRYSRLASCVFITASGAFVSLLYSSDISLSYLDQVDKYTNEFGLPFAAFCQCFAMGCVYRYKDVIDQIGLLGYIFSVISYLGAIVCGLMVGYILQNHGASIGFLAGLLFFIVMISITYLISDNPSSKNGGSRGVNKLYWITIYQGDQLRKDLNAVIAGGNRWEIPIVWAFIMKFLTGPATIVLSTFCFLKFDYKDLDKTEWAGLIAGFTMVIFLIIGIVIPRFFSVFLPKGEENKWKEQFQPGSAITLESEE